jgi:penicillin-binding protein 2
MTEFKNTERELYYFRIRLFAIAGLIFLSFALLFARFVWLQIVKHDVYATQAEDNRISVVPVTPNRGLILDRNGVVLARNFSANTLEITPSKINQDLDVVIDELAQLVDIEPKHRKRFKKLMEDSKSFESLPIRTRLTDEEVARFTVQRFRFPGVEIQTRLFRQYPLGETASHVIGYIGRISSADAKILDESESDSDNYNGTDYIGKEGLEKSYEHLLHGTTGSEEVEVSAGGRAVRVLSHSPATSGSNLILSIDIELQKIVEDAFGDKRGAFVAIDPETGDVLAFVSKPTYDPNLFVEGIDQANWESLNNSIDKPLVNRALTSAYPPGSTYKPYMALAALELGKRTTSYTLADPGFFTLAGHVFHDDQPGGHGMVDMYRSIVKSCDTYYFMLANDLGVDAIHDFMKPFGFGELTGIDLEHERAGILPSTEWKRNYYKKAAAQKWYAGETISLGIGQGYNSFTPLQIAHAVATLANNGIVMKPHLVKMIEDPQTHERKLTVSSESYRIPLKQENIDFIKHAMAGVTKEGTSAPVFINAGYESAGKTGTAQVVGLKKGEKYNANTVALRFRDHALYTAFAPVDKPRIAIGMIVENGGFGASGAAPIAKLALDYFLLGKRPDDKSKELLKTMDQGADQPPQEHSEESQPPADPDADNATTPAPSAAPVTPHAAASAPQKR